MPALDAKARFRADVPRDLLLSLVEGLRDARSQAARNASLVGLDGRAATELTGYQTHKVFEKKLIRLASSRGSGAIDGGFFPGTTLRCYQGLGMFGSVLIARASIFESRALPPQCATRINGSTINWPYSRQGELLGRDPGDDLKMFALLLTCRDKEVRGKFYEVAIGAIEPDYAGFIFYENVESFIAGYDEVAPEPVDGSGSTASSPFNLVLRNPSKPFEGGETPQPPDEEGGGTQP